MDVVEPGGRSGVYRTAGNTVEVTGVVHFTNCNASIGVDRFDNSHVTITDGH